MKEWTKRDRTERDKKVPRKNRTLTDWPSLSLRVTAPPPIYSRPTRSSEGNVGQYVRTFVRAFCHSGALWHCGSRGGKSGKPKHRNGMSLPFVISAGIEIRSKYWKDHFSPIELMILMHSAQTVSIARLITQNLTEQRYAYLPILCT